MFTRSLLLGCALFVFNCAAQTPPAPAAPAVKVAKPRIEERIPFFAAALSQLLSDTRSFTAGAVLELPTEPGAVPDALPFGVAMHQGRMRWEINLAQARIAALPKESVASFTTMGIDRIVIIFQPEKTMTVSFTGLQAYLELPMPKAPAAQDEAIAKLGKLERKPLGNEVVEGQPTEKFQVTVRGEANKNETATVWEATQLQNLPVKLRVQFADGAYTLQFRNVRLGKPDARYFEPPAGFTKFTDMNSLIQGALRKQMATEGFPTIK